MKQTLIAICLLALVSCATSQHTSNGQFEVVTVKEIAMSKTDIYKNSLLWIADSFRSASRVVEYKDLDSGAIVGNGVIKFRWGGVISETAQFKMKIEAKEKKYRITFKQVEILSKGEWLPIESYMKRRLMYPKLAKRLDTLSEDLQIYLQNTESEKKW